MRHRGLALKQRAKNHVLATMHTLPECAPTGAGEGPKKIGHRAGFTFHSEFKRHYARGLILELLEERKIREVPTSPGSSRNKYRLCPEVYTPLPMVTPDYLLDLQRQGADIIAEAGKIICYYLQSLTNSEHVWIASTQMEKETGLYESGQDKDYSGFWAWLVREELTHAGVIETTRLCGRIMIRLPA